MEASRTPQSALGQIAAVAPRLLDDALAERIESLLEPCGEGVWRLTLLDIVTAVPLLRSRPVSLDTAIDAVVRGMLARGINPGEIEQRLVAEIPELAEPVHIHMMLRSGVRERSTDEDATTARISALPAPFGPASNGGKRRYELVELVGSGSEGSVYRAYDRQLSADGRPLVVAIKILRSREPAIAERVTNEASRAMRLRHPAIAALLDWGLSEEGAYLVYEFVEGVTLRTWLKKQGIAPRTDAAKIVRDMAAGIQAAHNAGVVHRDLKPDNVIIRPTGEVCITDLGLMEAVSSDRGGLRGGSLAFAAPEQLRGGPGGADNGVDVYALGGMLYWLLTGDYPNGDSQAEVQRRMIHDASLPPVELERISTRDRTLYHISLRALAASPANRYSSAALLASDLQLWLEREPVLPFDRPFHRRLVLAAQRSPSLVAGASLVVALLLLSVWAAWRLDVGRQEAGFAIERERHKGELAAKQAVLDGELRRVDSVRALTTELGRTAELILTSPKDPGWLSMFSALESLTSSGILDMPGAQGELVDSRIKLVEQILADADAQGQRDSVEMAMWETSQVYWLLRGGQNARAAELATLNTERLGRMIPNEDNWLVVAQALQHLAALRADPTTPPPDLARNWLTTHTGNLPEPVREMVQETLSPQDS
ncbi:MAG: serine/threonine protein kinase [Phycisphaerales bacterium]|nr:serine/threonine protein kinase [Phycisphaerales bacterium]